MSYNETYLWSINSSSQLVDCWLSYSTYEARRLVGYNYNSLHSRFHILVSCTIMRHETSLLSPSFRYRTSRQRTPSIRTAVCLKRLIDSRLASYHDDLDHGKSRWNCTYPWPLRVLTKCDKPFCHYLRPRGLCSRMDVIDILVHVHVSLLITETWGSFNFVQGAVEHGSRQEIDIFQCLLVILIGTNCWPRQSIDEKIEISMSFSPACPNQVRQNYHRHIIIGTARSHSPQIWWKNQDPLSLQQSRTDSFNH